jgi:hypothetical protein
MFVLLIRKNNYYKNGKKVEVGEYINVQIDKITHWREMEIMSDNKEASFDYSFRRVINVVKKMSSLLTNHIIPDNKLVHENVYLENARSLSNYIEFVLFFYIVLKIVILKI